MLFIPSVTAIWFDPDREYSYLEWFGWAQFAKKQINELSECTNEMWGSDLFYLPDKAEFSESIIPNNEYHAFYNYCLTMGNLLFDFSIISKEMYVQKCDAANITYEVNCRGLIENNEVDKLMDLLFINGYQKYKSELDGWMEYMVQEAIDEYYRRLKD